jgi:two-component system OmpR family response regulator
MAATILGQAGYLVNVAGDAQGALASALKAPPRAILSTVTLPAVDGQPWWERLRSLSDGPPTPVIFLLGPSVVAADIRGFAAGVDDCLPKPFRVEDLERVVRVVLTRAPEPRAGLAAERVRALTPVQAMKPSHWHRPLSAFRGVLGEIGLPSLLVMLEMERKSGILIIEADEGTARFFMRKGRVLRAEVDEAAPLSGAAAVYTALAWTQGHFEFLVGDVGGVDEIQASTTFLLIEAARRTDETKREKDNR